MFLKVLRFCCRWAHCDDHRSNPEGHFSHAGIHYRAPPPPPPVCYWSPAKPLSRSRRFFFRIQIHFLGICYKKQAEVDLVMLLNQELSFWMSTELKKRRCLTGVIRNPTVWSYICIHQHLKGTLQKKSVAISCRVLRTQHIFVFAVSNNFCFWDPHSNNVSSEEIQWCGSTEVQ